MKKGNFVDLIIMCVEIRQDGVTAAKESQYCHHNSGIPRKTELLKIAQPEIFLINSLYYTNKHYKIRFVS